MTTAPNLLDVIRQYLAALEHMETGDELARFFSSPVVQEEVPIDWCHMAHDVTLRRFLRVQYGTSTSWQRNAMSCSMPW